MIQSHFERPRAEYYPPVSNEGSEEERNLAGLPGLRIVEVPVSHKVPRRNILVAEDDADLLYVTCVLLESSGFEVVPCSNPVHALAKFRERPTFDMLLTDLQMPQMSGLELAQSVAAVRPSLPVLIMSGSILSSDAHARIVSQGWRFLGKPFAIPELLQHVSDLTGAARVPAEAGMLSL